jgi:hypothetical protein
VVAAKKPVGRPRRVAAPAAQRQNGRIAQNGRVAQNGARFTVQFQVQTVVRAADMHDALRQAHSLGALEVLAITRES